MTVNWCTSMVSYDYRNALNMQISANNRSSLWWFCKRCQVYAQKWMRRLILEIPQNTSSTSIKYIRKHKLNLKLTAQLKTANHLIDHAKKSNDNDQPSLYNQQNLIVIFNDGLIVISICRHSFIASNYQITTNNFVVFYNHHCYRFTFREIDRFFRQILRGRRVDFNSHLVEKIELKFAVHWFKKNVE